MTPSELITSLVFVGHSLFSHDNPRMLDQLFDATQPTAVEAQIINGAPLSYNWQHAAEAEGINARTRLAEGVDAVIVTEAIPLANHLKWSNTRESVTQFYELARSQNPDVRFFLQETWHSLDSGTGVAVPFDDGMSVPWRERLEQDLSAWQAVVDDVNATTGGDIELLEAGQALARLEDAILAGTVPGLTSLRDVFEDDIHPNDIGFYYISLFQYAVLTGQSAQGLPRKLTDEWGTPYQAATAAQAQRLQEIADRAARKDAQRTALPPAPSALPQDPDVVRLNQSPRTAAPRTAKEIQRPIAINLAGIADWSPQAPFLDHFKTARAWIGHQPGRWGGTTAQELEEAGYLDDNGWPKAVPAQLGSIGTVLFADLPEEARSLAGRYRLRFEGDGIVEVAGRASNVRYGDNEIWFDFTPGDGIVEVRIQRSDRKKTGDYVRNISVVKQEHLDAFAAGRLFNPRWLDVLDGFEVLRFMDWMETNGSTQIGWEDRPLPTDYSWALKGVPAEVMLSLVNELGASPWFSMPHQSDDSYMRNFARLSHQMLDEDLKLYVEYSNEVWNWQFEQAQWAETQARRRWGGENLWMQYYGVRSAEMSQIWSRVFADAPDRLVRVIAAHTGWLGLEEQMLEAPLWRSEAPQNGRPADYFDAYAVTGYFGGVLGRDDYVDVVRAWIADSRARAHEAGRQKGLIGADLRAFVRAHQFDIATAQATAELRDGLISGQEADTLADLLTRILPYHAKVAKSYGMDLIMYEGGSHVVGVGPHVEDDTLTAFFTHYNYSDDMGHLYQELLDGWAALGGTLFNAYADVYAPGPWGSWGALRTLSDENPRWAVLEGAK
ncbi:hypothetical protein GFB49_12455 [Epibacterium sp. SM1979]|uniref:Uncharacterized protein n=1 Tax=Tritonibacter litoralis TaxID=2662264 RepID=A0A843YD37_9RHOB|nr:hypothetical protein [Tritonibacter litoralis]MQQ09270.1 hypothetical protein [Tritonibacter litoralis]